MAESKATSLKKIGNYVMEAKLGEGGMAEVWRARHDSLGTPVAIKFLNRQYAGNPEVEERFLNEGKRQAQLSHPHIVCVQDYIREADGHSYIVMRYVDGMSLDVLIDRTHGPLPAEQALAVSRDVISALAYAHAQQVVHRDVKPSNVLVDAENRAYLMDFGIALAVNERRFTRTGMVMGTPHYMSPEQILRPKEVDRRSDIYSFGCVLYEMLTGRPPFDLGEDEEGDTEYVVKNKHLHDTPSAPTKYNSAIPHGLEYITLRCLAKQPKDRFASCAELLEALDHYSDASRFPAAWSDPSLQSAGPKVDSKQPERRQTVVEERSPQGKVVEDRLPRAGKNKAALFFRPPVLIGVAVLAAALSGLLIWKPWQNQDSDHGKKQSVVVKKGDNPDGPDTPPKPVDDPTKKQPGPAERHDSHHAPVIHKGNPQKEPEKKEQQQEKKENRDVIAKNDDHGPIVPPPDPNSSSEDTQRKVTPPEPVFTGPTSGAFSWSGSLGKGEEITISQGHSSVGTLSGQVFPAVPVSISIRPKDTVAIVKQPRPDNNYGLLVLRGAKSGISQLQISWQVLPQ